MNGFNVPQIGNVPRLMPPAIPLNCSGTELEFDSRCAAIQPQMEPQGTFRLSNYLNPREMKDPPKLNQVALNTLKSINSPKDLKEIRIPLGRFILINEEIPREFNGMGLECLMLKAKPFLHLTARSPWKSDEINDIYQLLSYDIFYICARKYLGLESFSDLLSKLEIFIKGDTLSLRRDLIPGGVDFSRIATSIKSHYFPFWYLFLKGPEISGRLFQTSIDELNIHRLSIEDFRKSGILTLGQLLQMPIANLGKFRMFSGNNYVELINEVIRIIKAQEPGNLQLQFSFPKP